MSRGIPNGLLAVENDNLLTHLGPKRSALAMAVAQVYSFVNGKWCKLCCGVAIFVKDFIKRSYFISAFDLNSTGCSQQFEQEIYREFNYSRNKSFFHTFDGDENVIGLNFANEDDAKKFGDAVSRLLSVKLEHRSSRAGDVSKTSKDVSNSPATAPVITVTPTPCTGKKTASSRSSAKNKPKRLTPADIGMPSDFRQVAHVGLDSKTGKMGSFGIDTSSLPSEFQQLFAVIGFDVANESNETIRRVCETIDEYGGVSAVREAVAAALQTPCEQLVSGETAAVSCSSRPPRPPVPPNPKPTPPKPPVKPPPVRPRAVPVANATLTNIPPAPPLPPPLPPASNPFKIEVDASALSKPNAAPPTAAGNGMTNFLNDIVKVGQSGLKRVSDRPNPETKASQSLPGPAGAVDFAKAFEDFLKKYKRPAMSSSESESSESEGDDWM